MLVKCIVVLPLLGDCDQYDGKIMRSEGFSQACMASHLFAAAFSQWCKTVSWNFIESSLIFPVVK